MEKKKRNTIILRIVFLLLVIAGAAVSIVTINMKNNEYEKLAEIRTELELTNQDLSMELNARDSVVNDLLNGFDQIATNLESVRQRRNLVSAKTSESDLTLDKKDDIIKDIQMMNSLLDESKKQIANLDNRLKSSGIQTTELQKKISSLYKIIEVQTSDISIIKESLVHKDFEMAQLNEKMSLLEVDVIQKEELIAQQVEELNRAFYAYGTYKELKDRGLLDKEGGFLFLGQNKSIQEDFNDEYFTEINISEIKMIPVKSKKVELITEHPTGSYKLVEDNGEVAYLEIEDPEEFWKMSKYVVMELK